MNKLAEKKQTLNKQVAQRTPIELKATILFRIDFTQLNETEIRVSKSDAIEFEGSSKKNEAEP